jgi:phospholipid-binding lipoprotein MlaA
MSFSRTTLLHCTLLLTLLGAAGCAAPPPQAAAQPTEAYDPWENTNRDIFAFNQRVDRSVLVPAAEAYRRNLPQPVRDSIHNFLQNLDLPIVFANDVLQAEPTLAANTAGRFVVNSTVGVAGFFDPEGPYLVIPVLGPSTVRDAAGEAADSYGDPGNYVAGQHHLIWATILRTGTQGIDTRSRNIETLADIEKTSLDYYATIRSLYRQRRAAEIRHEQDNLPNVSPLTGSDSPAPMSYTFPK